MALDKLIAKRDGLKSQLAAVNERIAMEQRRQLAARQAAALAHIRAAGLLDKTPAEIDALLVARHAENLC